MAIFATPVRNPRWPSARIRPRTPACPLDRLFLLAILIAATGSSLFASCHLFFDLIERAHQEHAGGHAGVGVDAWLGLVQVVPVALDSLEGRAWESKVEECVLDAAANCHSSSPFVRAPSGAGPFTALWTA